MYTLYIDTHYINLVIALLLDGKIITKKELSSNKHSENTLNLIKEVLSINNISITNINEIIIINGPGSFTGVRIGIVISKIIGYTKHISLKPISYLQAASLNYNKTITLGIKDKNGIYIGKFNKKHELIDEYSYIPLNTNQDITIIEDNIDIEKVFIYLQDKPSINPHNLKPLYIKKIEVQNA